MNLSGAALRENDLPGFGPVMLLHGEDAYGYNAFGGHTVDAGGKSSKMH